MSYYCEVIEPPARPALSVRTRTPVENLKAVLGEGFKSVFLYLTELGEHPAGAPFVAYYNMDMQDLDIEIGFPVSRVLPDKAEVQTSEIPAGKHATCLYTGPYEGLPPAYEALTAWIQAHGYEPTGVAYEHYLNDPATTLPEALQTQIAFPLKAV